MRARAASLSRSVLPILIFSLKAFGAPPVQGIENFHQVDDHVYRGAQPSTEGFKYLAKIGVKTIVDLREHDERSIAEERVVTALGMFYVNVPMSGMAPPTEAEITKILGLLEDPSTGFVFVHCKRGADRTGVVIGAYRIDYEHWDNARALSEAMSRGMSFFQFPRQKYIRRFQPRPIEVKSSGAKVSPTAAPAVAIPAPIIH